MLPIDHANQEAIKQVVDWVAISQAAMGGFSLNMMNLYKDQFKAKSERTTKDSIYFILFVFWPIAGAGLAYIYMCSGYQINGLLAFNIGLSAPVILQNMMSKDPSPVSVKEGQ